MPLHIRVSIFIVVEHGHCPGGLFAAFLFRSRVETQIMFGCAASLSCRSENSFVVFLGHLFSKIFGLPGPLRNLVLKLGVVGLLRKNFLCQVVIVDLLYFFGKPCMARFSETQAGLVFAGGNLEVRI